MPPVLVLTLLAVVPWAWAALLMAGFVGLTVLTMALARLPTRRAPPPVIDNAEAPDGPVETETLPAEDLDHQGKEA